MATLAECFDAGKVPHDIREEVLAYGNDIDAVKEYLADIQEDIGGLAREVGAIPATDVKADGELRQIGEQELGDTFESRRKYYSGKEDTAPAEVLENPSGGVDFYHGTNDEFDSFDEIHSRAVGHYFTANPLAASQYGEVKTVQLSVSNPLIVPFEDVDSWTIPGLDQETSEDIDDNDAQAAYAKKAGHDAIIWPNGNFTEESYAVAVFDSDLITMDDGKKREFQQGQKRGPGGIIEMVDDLYIISLFPDANASTLIHETGHLFLEELRSIQDSGLGSDQAGKDWDTIKEYLGNEGTAITEPQHEKWAQAFEVYTMSGKAPSVELDGPFSRFKKWLTEVYRKVSVMKFYGKLDKELSPEVTMVMDRMLATEEQTEQLGVINGMRASMSTLENLPSVGGTQRSRLQRLINETVDNMAHSLWKTRTRRTAELVRQWRAEIQESMDGERVYQAWENIKASGGLNPVLIGSEFDKATVGILRGKGLIAKQKGKNLAPGNKEDGYGMGHDAAGRDAGYNDGIELVNALLTANNPRNELNDRIKARVEAADAQVPPTEAIIDTPAVQEFANATAQYYSEALGATPQNKQAIKDEAAQAFWAMPTRDALRVDRFLGSVQRHMANERKALANGDTQLALDENIKGRKQMEQAKLSRKFRETHLKALRKISKIAKTKRGKIEEQHHRNVIALIDRFKLARIPTLNGQPVVDFTNKATLVEVLQGEVGGLGIPSIAEQYDAHIKDEKLSADYRSIPAMDFEQVAQLVNMLNDRGRSIVNDWNAYNKMKNEDVVADLLAQSENLKSIDRATRNRAMGSTIELLRRIRSDLKQMPFVLRHMDGHAPGADSTGPMQRMILDPLAEAQRDNEIWHRDVERKLKEPMEHIRRSMEEMGAFPTTTVPVPKNYADKYNNQWTNEQIFAVALNMGNQYNMDSVAKGMGFVNEDGTVNTQPLHNLVTILTEEDWNAVQTIWGIVDSFWPQLAEQHRRLNFYTPPKVEADELTVTTRDGKAITVEGGYYPITFDAALDDVVAAQQETYDLLNASRAAFPPVAAKAGQLKSRQGVSGKPVLLSLGALASHITYSGKIITHAKAVHDANRVLSNPDYRAELKRVWGDEIANQINPWLRAQLGTETEDIGGFGRLMNKMRPHVTSFYLFGNIKTSVLQLSAVVDLVAEVGVSKYTAGVRSIAAKLKADPLGAIKWMDELSPFMESRRVSREREVDETRKAAKISMAPSAKLGSKNVVHKLGKGTAKAQRAATDFFAFMLSFPAWLVEAPAWIGVYESELSSNGGDSSKAASTADQVISRNQPSMRPMDQAYMQRSKNGAHVFMTFFSSFAFTFGNRSSAAWGAMKSGNMSKLDFAKYWGITALATPALTALGYAALWGRDFDDEDDQKKIAADLFSEVASYQFQGIPMVNQAVRGMSNMIAGKFTGDPWKSPAFALPEKTINVFNSFYKFAIDMESEDTRDRALWSLFELASIASKVPASRIADRMMEGLRQVDEENANWQNLFIPDPELRER